MNRRMKIACGLLLSALAVAGCGSDSPEEIETSNPVPVAVASVRRGPIRAVVSAAGVVVAAPGAELLVVAPQPARILELPKAEGDRVRKGDLLVRFEVPALDADAAGRRADLARAAARLETARAAAERASGLFVRGIAARKEMEDAERELADAQADVAGAKSALAAAGVLAARATVRAPFDGVVAGRWHNPGDLVDAAAGDPILRLLDPARLQIQASVPLADLAGIAVGDAARVLGPGSSASMGTVTSRPAAIDPTTGTAAVRIALSAAARLPAGAPVQVEILGAEHRDAILVPAAAVVEEGPQRFVYVVDAGGRAHRRSLTEGIAADGVVEARSGVAPGERVIVQGQNALPDGARVTVATGAPVS